jgi:hypothetical protein
MESYPSIQDLQAEFQMKNLGVYFKKVPSLSITELVWIGDAVSDKAVQAWADFLKERADKFLIEGGMYSERMCRNLAYWMYDVRDLISWQKYGEYRVILSGYVWYTNVVRILSDTTGRGLRDQYIYRQISRKELEDEDEDEDDDGEEEEKVAAVVVPTVEGQIDAFSA